MISRELSRSLSIYFEGHKPVVESLFLAGVVGISLAVGSIFLKDVVLPERPDISCNGAITDSAALQQRLIDAQAIFNSRQHAQNAGQDTRDLMAESCPVGPDAN